MEKSLKTHVNKTEMKKKKLTVETTEIQNNTIESDMTPN